MEYFKCGSHGYHARYHIAFCVLFEHLELGIHPSVNDLIPHLNRFDLSPDEPANGYRSLLDVVHKCCLHLVQLCRHISVNRGSLFFRSAHYCRELECFVETLGQLRACLYYAQKLIKYCQKGNLFPEDEYMTDNVAEELMMEVELLSQDCFYGRCLGFQFCESMQKPLNVVSIAMASFSEGYQETSNMMQLASSLFNSGKYILNPDLRAQQVVSITRTADISFCKAFWSITEASIMQQLPYLVGPSIQVDNLITLSPETFEISNREGSETVTITPPCAHRGPSPVQVRLLSHKLRQGQKNSDGLLRTLTNRSPEKCLPMSPCLVVHCHGGGFVAQSSKSHEVSILRQWANDLKYQFYPLIFFSTRESFPRAVEECFYVYAWALKNCRQLGSTGEVVCLAGGQCRWKLMVSTACGQVLIGYNSPMDHGAYTPSWFAYTSPPESCPVVCLQRQESLTTNARTPNTEKNVRLVKSNELLPGAEPSTPAQKACQTSIPDQVAELRSVTAAFLSEHCLPFSLAADLVVKTALKRKQETALTMKVTTDMKRSCINAYGTYRRHLKDKEALEKKTEGKLQSAVIQMRKEKAKRIAKLIKLQQQRREQQQCRQQQHGVKGNEGEKARGKKDSGHGKKDSGRGRFKRIGMME
ncbi:hypothetical protein ScPMuIL_002534 [Solemya velum]